MSVTLDDLAADLSAIKQHLGITASDADMSGKYGDPEVKFEPRGWTGDVMKGRKFSQCPTEFLVMLAGMFDYFAQKNDQTKAVDDKGRPKSTWDRKNAALARGWADRNRRTGAKPVTPKQSFDQGQDVSSFAMPEDF